MDHGLTFLIVWFLIVCKIYYYDFWFYPNLFSLAFKGLSSQVSRVTLSRYFITLFCLMQRSSSGSDFHSLCVKICLGVLFTLGTS